MKVVEVIDVDTTLHILTVSCHYGNSQPHVYVEIAYEQGRQFWFHRVLDDDMNQFSKVLPPALDNALLECVIAEFHLTSWAECYFEYSECSAGRYFRSEPEVDGCHLAKLRRDQGTE